MSGGGAPTGAGAIAAPAALPVFRDAPLPDQCPPADAIAPSNSLLIRLVRTNTPAAEEFLSCHLEGKIPPRRFDPCVWRACSFFVETTPKEVLEGIAKGKNHLDKKFKAYVRVGPLNGLIRLSSAGNHVSFWMYDSFLPEIAVERVEPI